jgi:tetratricopeptide (TPR) repeat protein
MNTKTAGLLIAAILLSFFGGFYLANSLNRSEMEMLKAAKNPPSNSPQNDAEQTLSPEEIRQKIAEADANPDDVPFQKSLGMALYRYAAMRQDVQLLSEVSRLLLRVNDKNPDDKEVEITLGNLYFDIGYFQKDNENLKKAQQFYQRILARTPEDVDVRTDYGLTYFLQNPPQYDKAAAEFQKSLQANPRHEKTLQFLIQTLIKQDKTKEAETYLARLKEVNPKNTQSLAEIQAQMAHEENNSRQ